MGVRLRFRLLAAGSGLLLLAGTLWLLLAGGRGVNAAAVLTCGLTALLVVLAIFPPPWRGKLADIDRLAVTAENLARAVYDREATEQGRFLAQGGDAHPANVRYSQPSWVSWHSHGSGSRGSLDSIAEFYDELDRGRLVLLGAPGSGKTVLANQLLLDRITKMLSGGLPLRPGSGIPVRFSLPAFDPGGDKDANAAASRLDDWIAVRIAEDFRLRKDIATRLVRDGWILPVLDGLDEMDAETRTDSEDDSDDEYEADDEERAAAVVRALNVPMGGRLRPVVVTCRTDRYRELSRADAPGQEHVLLNAATVELEPLSAGQVAKYLASRFPDPADHNQAERRWRGVIRQIQARPHGQLALALSSPLRLFMAVTAYYRSRTRPAEMSNVAKGCLDQHLFGSYLPAVIEQHPRDGGERYDPDDVKRWLGTLARQLNAQQLQATGSGSDLSLDQLWQATGARTPRYLSAAVHGLLVAALLVIVAWRYSLAVSFPLDLTRPGEVAIGIGVAAVVLVTWKASRVRVYVSRLGFELPTATVRREIRLGLGQLMAVGSFLSIAFLLVIGLGHWIGLSLIGWLASGLVVGVAAGIVWIKAREKGAGSRRIALIIAGSSIAGILCGYLSWTNLNMSLEFQILLWVIAMLCSLIGNWLFNFFVDSLTEEPSAIDRPSDLVAQGIVYDLTFGVGFIVVLGALGGVVGWYAAGRHWDASGIAAGLAAGVVAGQWWNADSPWLRYMIAVYVLKRRRELPGRPALFLNWAYRAGLLRLSGISIQFRHREFQTWLTGNLPREKPPRSQGFAEVTVAIAVTAVIICISAVSLRNIGRFLEKTLTDPGIATYSVTFGSGGRTLAVGDFFSGSTQLWDIASGRQTATFTVPDSVGVTSLAFSPDGGTLAVGDVNGNTYLWDVTSGRLTSTFTDPHSDGADSLAFSPDGGMLAVGDFNGSAYLWDISSGQQAGAFTDPHSGGVTSLAFSPAGRMLVPHQATFARLTIRRSRSS